MKYFRNIALVASLAAGLALPAMAQTASTDTSAPKASSPAATAAAPQSAALPDAGVKKATPSAVKHTRHAAHKVKATKPGVVKKIGAK
jgi:hypothetical protein